MITNTLREKINCKSILSISICVFLITFVAQVYVSNRLAVKGRGMVELHQKQFALEKEISELRLEQSKYSSLSYIESKAVEVGFEQNVNFVSTITPVTSTAVVPSF